VTDENLNEPGTDGVKWASREEGPWSAETSGDDVGEPGADESRARTSGGGQDDLPPQYGIGPFTVREVAIGGVWLVAFVVSFFSLSQLGFVSVWTRGIDWILAIGVPTAAVFLLALRRLSPTGIRRVGSLGIDQFASVAFSVAAVVWLERVWLQVSLAASGGLWETTWVLWVELVLMLAGVVLTVFAPLIPVLEQDFQGRPDAAAHRSSRPIRGVVPRPRPEPSAAPAASPFVGSDETNATTPVDVPESWVPPVTTDEPAPQQHQAFWALAPEEREVLDENGLPLFRIGPAAWALVIEDRGAVFVIRHEDGRIGYLHDVSDVTRG